MTTVDAETVGGGHRLLRWMSDVRGFQYAFSALFFLDLGVRAAVGARWSWWSWPVASIAVVVALLVVTPFLRVERGSTTSVVLAVIDIGVVGISRLTYYGASGLLIMMPTLWLGRIAGRRGAIVSVLATVLLVSLPSAIYAGWAPVEIARAVLYPFVVGAATLAMAESMEWVRAERTVVERQRDQLAEALETIARQQRMSNAIFDSVDVGLALLDSDGRYLSMNRRAQEFLTLAYPAEQEGATGRHRHAYGADGRLPLGEEQLPGYRASRGEEFDDLRMWVGSDPATRRALSVTARSVRSADGTLEAASLATTDVTDLMRALQVKDEFVALVSHELRTPLTSIVGYAQMLEDDPGLSPRGREQLVIMQRNADRLHRLIADILEIAQRDRGVPLTLCLSSADLVEIVEQSIEATRPAAAASDVDLVLDAPESLMVSVDPQRISQVADNLLSNAVKYSERGGRVDVRLEGGSDYVQITVADTGIGISAQDRKRLFTPFFRTDDAARRAVAGAGLGLSITRDIVTGHGGTIDVDSEPGRGSAFRVRLPR